jgi:hypothetical protein
MKRLACFLPGLCLFSPILRAQSTNATISGGVTDGSGRFVVDASVDIVNDETGVVYSVKTNASGIYFVPILPPGHYHVQVSKPGFKTLIKPDVILNVQSAIALNFALPIGAKSESITVEAGTSILNTTDASVSTVIDSKFVENMPLNGRSFQDLISMTPGIATQSPQTSQAVGASGDFSVNGQRTESNYYTVDGVSANGGAGAPNGGPQPGTSGSIGATTALGTTQSLISVDALQEFRVSSSTYSAEYGRSPGGQFSLLTRSGTKLFHGSAFDYLRNNFFDANNWFNDHYQSGITALRQNDFGGTLGGPVLLPGTFSKAHPSYFFVSYEGLRLTQPQAASIQYVPSLSMRLEAPSSLQGILNAFPVPTPGGISYASGLAQFIQGYSLPSKIDSTSVRLDDTVSHHLALFFRFSNTPSSIHSRLLSSATATTFATQTYTGGATSQFTDRASNEFRIGYAASDASSSSKLDSFGGAMPIDLNAAIGNSTVGGPTSIMDLSFAGTGESILQVTTNANQSRQWNIVDTFSLGLGKHQLKFGFDYRRIQSPLLPSSPYVSGIFLSGASVLRGLADIAVLYKLLPATPVFNETAAFAQDEWHLRPGLTVSGGIRWEVNPPPSEAHGNDAFTLTGNLDDPRSLALAPRGTSLWKTSWFNLAPRLGVAWTVHNKPGWETVLRTGSGVFFDTGNQLAALGFQYLGFSAIETKSNFALPVSASELTFQPSVTPPYSSTVVAFPNHLQAPYTLQWNVSAQQAIHGSQTFTLSYVGSNGRRLLQLQQRSITALNPNFGVVDFVNSTTTSNYQALQAQFQRSVQHGLQVLASYTWSHSIDFGSTNAALPLMRGNSDYDLRNNFQAGLTWELPVIASSATLKVLLSGWAVDSRFMTRTSFPITLRGNLLTNSATGESYYGNVNLVQGQPIYVYGSQYPGGRSVNRAAFQKPVAADAGNAPRNFVRGFGATQVNLAVRRTFPIFKRSTLQFRAEAFNLLNHPIFGLVDSTLTDVTFGQATQTLNQSLSTLSAQYQQGGPRSLQFALKLQF